MSKAGGKSTHLTGKKVCRTAGLRTHAPLTFLQAKKGPSTLDDDDLEFQKKQQAEKKAMQAMATKVRPLHSVTRVMLDTFFIHPLIHTNPHRRRVVASWRRAALAARRRSKITAADLSCNVRCVVYLAH